MPCACCVSEGIETSRREGGDEPKGRHHPGPGGAFSWEGRHHFRETSLGITIFLALNGSGRRDDAVRQVGAWSGIQLWALHYRCACALRALRHLLPFMLCAISNRASMPLARARRDRRGVVAASGILKQHFPDDGVCKDRNSPHCGQNPIGRDFKFRHCPATAEKKALMGPHLDAPFSPNLRKWSLT